MKLDVILSNHNERMTVEAQRVGSFAVTRAVNQDAAGNWVQVENYYQLYHAKTGMRMTNDIPRKKWVVELAEQLMQLSNAWDEIDGSSAIQTVEVLGRNIARRARMLVYECEDRRR